MVSGGDFPRKHLNRQPGVRTGFKFSGPGPIRDRNGGRVLQNTKKTIAKQSILGPQFSTFPGINVKNYIIVYVVGASGAHFRESRVTRRKPLIPFEQEGADLMRFRDFFAPLKTTNKRLRLCRYFEVVFQE